MKIIERFGAAYETELRRLSLRGDEDLGAVESSVRAILDEVREGGDRALVRLCERFEKRVPARLVYTREDFERGLSAMESSARDALARASKRIADFHQRQVEKGLRYTDADGVELGWRTRPMQRVGVYAPGGKARYPSSVLMSVIPAKVAGVPEVVVVTPRPTDEILAAAALSGADRVIDVGGAQAIAALAYGTESVPRVDKIVGPGNIYVACAKKLVFGRVAIDGIAGPSEILVVADGGADPRVVAADLLSQAEHDEAAYPLLVTLDRAFAERVLQALEAQLAALPRREIASASVARNGAVFVVADLAEAARVASELAVEHVSLQVRDADALLDAMGAGGAIFMGDHTPEAAGDYLAGPSHVLPTGGAVRFSSALGVNDFVLRQSVIRYSRASLARHAADITTLARLEGLEAHARAVEVRLHSEAVGLTASPSPE